jgi:phospholipid/cholesterol/gamma-HCH transport system substrate-binding protein
MNKTAALRNALIAAVLVLVAGAITAAGTELARPLDPTYTAQFQRTVGLYRGSKVTVLGVPVGNVVGVAPHGAFVTVRFRVSRKVSIPAAARAVVVAPTLVSDRGLELTPAYTSGPTLRPAAVIPLERTAVPVEIDQVLTSVKELSDSLGPNGANRHGALNQLVRSGANAFRGNGPAFKSAIVSLNQALAAVDGGSDDLATTLKNLAVITAAFARADQPVLRLSSTLAKVTRSLADQRGELVGAVDSLGTAMREIQALVRESGPAFTSNVAGILDSTRTILKQEQALRETLNLAPVALQNFIGTFDPQTSALNARVAINGTLTTDPSLLICQLISSNGLGSLCPAVNRVLDPLEPLLQSLPKPLGEGPEVDSFVPGRTGRAR